MAAFDQLALSRICSVDKHKDLAFDVEADLVECAMYLSELIPALLKQTLIHLATEHVTTGVCGFT